MEALSQELIDHALEQMPTWGGDTNGISATYIFKDFIQAMAFMQACIDDIEAQQHHPEWSNVYHTVMVSLRTHDANNKVTDKDLVLARTLDQHAQAIFAR